MRGTILSSTIDRAAAAIRGDNGERYRFTSAEWRGTAPPRPGERVAFVAEGSFAREVTPLPVPVPGARPRQPAT